jgi:hypothetical protein
LILLNPSIKNSTFKPASPTRKAFGVDNYLNSLNADTFNRTKISFGNNASRQDIENFIGQIEQGSVSEYNSGWQAKFYKISDEIGIKAPFPKDEFGDKLGHNNVLEHFILKKIQKIDPNISTTPIDLIEKESELGPKYYLAMKIVKGKPINNSESNLTKEQLQSLMGQFFALDKEGIMHFDLQNENIFLENPIHSRLIDFGSFSMLDDKGDFIYSDNYSSKNNPVKELETIAVDASPQKKYARNLLNTNHIYINQTQKNNPFLNFVSNVQNFEYRTMHDYLFEKGTKDPKSAQDFLKAYLQEKSVSYHLKMKEFLSSINIDEFVTTEDSLGHIEQAKQLLQKAIRHEEVSAEVLKNPSENILKTELAKMQLRYARAGNNQITNEDILPSIYANFVKTTNEYAQNAAELEKEYFENTLLIFKESIENTNTTLPNKALPDKQNILKVVFKNIENSITTSTSKPTVSSGKSNTKIYAIIAGVLAIGGAVAYFIKNQKELNHKPR